MISNHSFISVKMVKNGKNCPPARLLSTTSDYEGEQHYKLVPPDGGWGWLVLAGSMMVNILVPGTVKSFGVLFVEFLEVFDASPAAAAWIPALCYFLYSSLGKIIFLCTIFLFYYINILFPNGTASSICN